MDLHICRSSSTDGFKLIFNFPPAFIGVFAPLLPSRELLSPPLE
jgi:hypothetical protein